MIIITYLHLSNYLVRYHRGDRIHRTNNGNISKLWRKVEKSTKFQSDPIGNVMNLSKYKFSKATYRLLNKNLNFVPTQKKYNRNEFENDIENFYRRIKLTAHFGTHKTKQIKTEEETFKPNQTKNGHLKTLITQ